jgi:hypothetical protein
MRTLGLLLLALACLSLAAPVQSQQRRAPRGGNANAAAAAKQAAAKAEAQRKQRAKVEEQGVKRAVEALKDANERGKARLEQRETGRAAGGGGPTTRRTGATNGPRAGSSADRPTVRAQRPLSPAAKRRLEDRNWRLRLERDRIRRDSALQEREREKAEILERAKAEAETKAAEAPVSEEPVAKDDEEAPAQKPIELPPRAKPYGPMGKIKGGKRAGARRHR